MPPSRGEIGLTFTLYDAVVPPFLQMLRSMAGLLEKAEAYCTEHGIPPEQVLEARLAADMLPFAYQVKSVAVHSIGAMEGAMNGSFSPDQSEPGKSFAA